MSLGATYLGGARCHFVVWAPLADTVEVKIFEPRGVSAPQWSVLNPVDAGDRWILLDRVDRGYHQGILADVEPGTEYAFRLNREKQRPDPASRFQPAGIHGPSQIRNPNDFGWSDHGWRGLALDDYIFYELHTGTFTTEGTFDAIIPHLDAIKELGATVIELMPVAQFPGERNWGYDGVHPFAVQNTYGGPHGLKRLVNACHARGMAAVLDVVYNHLGPEGNYFGDFGPYFTDRYRSPWGQTINFDGPDSDEVVRFFTENALYWVNEFHFDALRLDAIHGIVDRNAQPFLQLVAQAVHEFAEQAGRKIYMIAESDFNDARYVLPVRCGGYGFDGQWNDDFHHALHALLTREQNGYYLDFGCAGHLQKAFEEGFVYSGQYSAFRHRRHGNSSAAVPARQFVVCAQNHDQAGNRMRGERLSTLVGFEALKLAAGIVILSPFLPLLFMGEEYAELAPFQYFISHQDPGLVEAVRRGRREEFAESHWQADPPDPQAPDTFWRSKLDHRLRDQEPHRTFFSFVRELIRIRKALPYFSAPSKKRQEVRSSEEQNMFQVRRWNGDSEGLLVANFNDTPGEASLAVTSGHWRKLADSADSRWRGPGSSVPDEFDAGGDFMGSFELPPQSFCVFERS